VEYILNKAGERDVLRIPYSQSQDINAIAECEPLVSVHMVDNTPQKHWWIVWMKSNK
jgi:hypothetical protein